MASNRPRESQLSTRYGRRESERTSQLSEIKSDVDLANYEPEHPAWMSWSYALELILFLPDNMIWNSFFCALTLMNLVLLSMDYVSQERIFGLPISRVVDLLYNILYVWFVVDAISYLHYLKFILPASKSDDIPYMLTITCYYLRLRRNIVFILGLTDYYLEGSISGSLLKYWYMFLMVRVLFSNVFVWTKWNKLTIFKHVPAELHSLRSLRFLRAFYVINKRFLPIGVDTPPPDNAHRLQGLIILLTGSLLVTGISIASLALILSVYMKAKHMFHARFGLIVNEMIATNVPGPLRRKVETFYEMYWLKQKAVSMAELLPTYPPALLKTLNTDIYFEALQKSRILRDLSTHFLTEVAQYMKTIYYVPGDLIIKRESRKFAVVFISYGDVQMVTAEDDETPILRFTRGTILNPCGACVDVASCKAYVCVRAATFCTVHVLMTSDLWHVALKHGHFDGQTNIIHSALDEHLSRVVQHYAKRPHPPVEYKTTIEQLKQNMIELKLARDENGKLLLKRHDIFLQLANCYIMRNVHPFYIFYLKNIYSTGFVFFNFMVTFIYVVDIIVRLSTGEQLDTGVPVNFVQTASSQIGSVWFLLDVVAAAPIFQFMFGGQFAGMNKLFKLPYVFRAIRKLEERYVSYSGTFRFLCVCLLILVTIWLLAAMNYSFLCFEYKICRYLSFVNAVVPGASKPATTARDLEDAIAYSTFWSVCFTTFTSHLTTDLSRENFRAQVWILLIMEFCAMLYIFVNSAYAATLMDTELLRNQYDVCLDTVEQLFKKRHVDPILRYRFINYLQLCWFTDKAYGINHEKKSILFDLPHHVHQDVSAAQWNKYLLCIPFIRKVPQDMLNSISARVHVFYVAPNEILVNTGDIVNEIYVIKRGVCEVLEPVNKKVKCIISSKAPFGDFECLMRFPAYYTVRAVTHVEVCSIARKHLMKAIAARNIRSLIIKTKKEPLYLELFKNRHEQFLKYVKPAPPPNRMKLRRPRRHEADTEYLQPFQRLGFFSVFRYVFPRYTIHPDGRYLRWYEVFRAFCAFLSAVIGPSYFLLSLQFPTVLSYTFGFLDMTAYFDIVQRMLVGYFNEKGILVYHPASTAIHYLGSAFIVDLLGCLPTENLDDIGLYFYAHHPYNVVSKTMQLLMFNRCLQLYRLPSALGVLENCIKKRDILYCVKVLPLFIVLITSVAALISVSSVIMIHYKNGTWLLHVHSPSWLDNATCVGYDVTKTPFNLWLTMNYWVTSQLTTTGLINFEPHTIRILYIFSCSMFISSVFILYIAVRVLSIRSNVNPALAHFWQNIKDVIVFMKQAKCPQPLQREVLAYYDYTWAKTGGTDYHSVFKLCDHITLRTDAILHIYGHTFEMCQILKRCDKSLVRLLGRAMRSVYFCQDMTVIQRHDITSELYFVDYGTIHACDPEDDDEIIALLPCGSVFGNMNNNVREVSPSSFIAGSNVHLLKIDVTLFHEILKDFPDTRARLAKLRPNLENYLVGFEDTKISLKRRKASNAAVIIKRKGIMKYFPSRSGVRSMMLVFLMTVSLMCIFLDAYHAGFPNDNFNAIILVYILDLAFLAKLVMEIMFPYYSDEDIDLSLVSKAARKKYLYGEFKYDILSLLPLELFSLCFNDPWEVVAYFRLNRLLRAVTVHSCLKKMRMNLNANHNLLSVISMIIKFSMFIHINTCVWYFLGTLYDVGTPNSSWLWERGNNNDTYHVCFENRYICSLYYIIVTFLRNGGNIGMKPKKQIEVIYICLLMVLSIIIYNIYLGEIISIVHYLSFRCLNFHEKFFELKEFLKNNRVSETLESKIKKYTLYIWREARGLQSPRLVDTAPQCLRLEIMSAAYMKHLKKNPIFENCEHAFLRQLVGHFKPYYYDGNMYVVREGEITNAMYFIHKGTVRELLDEEETQFYKTGTSFGAVHGIYRNFPYRHSYKTRIKSQILTLSLDTWEYLLSHYSNNVDRIYGNIQDPRTSDEFQNEKSEKVRSFSPKPLMTVNEELLKKTDLLSGFPHADSAAHVGVLRDRNLVKMSKSTELLFQEMKDKIRGKYELLKVTETSKVTEQSPEKDMPLSDTTPTLAEVEGGIATDILVSQEELVSVPRLQTEKQMAFTDNPPPSPPIHDEAQKEKSLEDVELGKISLDEKDNDTANLKDLPAPPVTDLPPISEKLPVKADKPQFSIKEPFELKTDTAATSKKSDITPMRQSLDDTAKVGVDTFFISEDTSQHSLKILPPASSTPLPATNAAEIEDEPSFMNLGRKTTMVGIETFYKSDAKSPDNLKVLPQPSSTPLYDKAHKSQTSLEEVKLEKFSLDKKDNDPASLLSDTAATSKKHDLASIVDDKPLISANADKIEDVPSPSSTNMDTKVVGVDTFFISEDTSQDSLKMLPPASSETNADNIEDEPSFMNLGRKTTLVGIDTFHKSDDKSKPI